MVESHTKQQSPETVSEMELQVKRSKSAGLSSRTQEREQWGFFFWRWVMMWAKEISEGAHVGTTTHQGAPGGPGAPRWVVPTWCTLFAPKIQKYSEKNRIQFSGHSENFYFWVIFLLPGKFWKQINHGILFYLTNKNRKQKVGTEGSAY